VDPEFAVIVAYRCPNCHASLEAWESVPSRFLRCPGCGKASLPPDSMRIDPPPYLGDFGPVLGRLATGGLEEAFDSRPRPMGTARPARPMPTRRLVLGSGFFLTTILFFFSMLDPSAMGRAWIFGLAAVAFLVALARSGRRPRVD